MSDSPETIRQPWTLTVVDADGISRSFGPVWLDIDVQDGTGDTHAGAMACALDDIRANLTLEMDREAFKSHHGIV